MGTVHIDTRDDHVTSLSKGTCPGGHLLNCRVQMAFLRKYFQIFVFFWGIFMFLFFSNLSRAQILFLRTFRSCYFNFEYCCFPNVQIQRRRNVKFVFSKFRSSVSLNWSSWFLRKFTFKQYAPRRILGRDLLVYILGPYPFPESPIPWNKIPGHTNSNAAMPQKEIWQSTSLITRWIGLK